MGRHRTLTSRHVAGYWLSEFNHVTFLADNRYIEWISTKAQSTSSSCLVYIFCLISSLHILLLGWGFGVLRVIFSSILYFLEAWFHSYNLFLVSLSVYLWQELYTLIASISWHQTILDFLFSPRRYSFAGGFLLFGGENIVWLHQNWWHAVDLIVSALEATSNICGIASSAALNLMVHICAWIFS